MKQIKEWVIVFLVLLAFTIVVGEIARVIARREFKEKVEYCKEKGGIQIKVNGFDQCAKIELL